METATMQSDPKRLEVHILSAGFLLLGVAVAVTTASYVSNMAFSHQWLVWTVGVAFAAVALVALECPRALRHPTTLPRGRLRSILLLSIPLAFVLSSQVCGLGVVACSAACHTANLLLIGLGAVTAIRLHRDQPVVALLIPAIVVALVPHCICHAPINTVWHSLSGGYAPTCEMLPLGAMLFSVSALRGVRIHTGAMLVGVMYGVMLFIIVGGLLFGFPWQGCVNHPA